MPGVSGELGTGSAGTTIPNRAVLLSGWFGARRFANLSGLVGAASVGTVGYQSGATIYAASPSLADVQAAIALASPGDTVRVPAGSATWAYYLVVTKGIQLNGAGIGSTVITCPVAGFIRYLPSSATIAADDPFRLSGFTLNTGACDRDWTVVYLENLTATPLTKNRVDHIRFVGGGSSAVVVKGTIYGVGDNLIFDNIRIPARGLGNQRNSWDAFSPVSFGGADNFYYEDCTVIGSGFWEGGHGGRYAVRHCAGTLHNDSDIFDAHGNQPTLLYATMKCEVYENDFTEIIRYGTRLFAMRGGQSLCFNNRLSSSVSGANAWVDSYNDYDDAICPVNNTDLSMMYPHSTYSFGNTFNGVPFGEIYISGTAYETAIGRVAPVKDLDVFSQITPFTGASGVGSGLLSARPASCSLEGAGYWATDESKLYRWTSGAWELFYTPYTYPHPLLSDPNIGD